MMVEQLNTACMSAINATYRGVAALARHGRAGRVEEEGLRYETHTLVTTGPCKE